jgi:hypothetical protein
VRPCDEPDGTRTWDVFEITPGERELARIEERPAGLIVAQAFKTRASARAYASKQQTRDRIGGGQ